MRWSPALLLLACGDPDAADTDFEAGVTFAEVGPIFERSCSPCHYGAATATADLRLEHPDQFVGVPHAATGLELVQPGSDVDSYLWLKLVDGHLGVPGGSGGVMPPSGSLAEGELDTVRAWILGGAEGEGEPPPEVDPCADAHPGCASGCTAGPATVTHAAWHNRLTESPELTWDAVPGASGYEVSIGSAPGADDALCWTDVGATTTHTLRALWALQAEQTAYANVRAIVGDERSAVTSSAGWTVDIAPPDPPTGVDDDRASVDGYVAWDHDRTDVGAGFTGFEVAVGTSPNSDDAVPWTDVGTGLDTTLSELASVPEGSWYWLSVRAGDAAGNRSQPATSVGFITCPPEHAFVPSDDALGTTPFCLAAYEMRIAGNDDGSTPYDPTLLPDSRPTGTPWASIDKGQARVACDSLGFSYQLVANHQWQAAARSIERTASNWSGGDVGVGAVPQGHSDESPLQALASDGGPCVGTGNPDCTDPASPDFSQRRTHELHNGEVVWDLAGNLTEQVDGSTGGPDGLWMSFDAAAFTVDPGFEGYRDAFAPAGPFTEAHGLGRMYGGTGNLTRGGSFDAASAGSAGSAGWLDTGVFQAHRNTWNTTATVGFRCVFVPM